MKRSFIVASIALGIFSSPVMGRDIGVLSLPIHGGKWTSSVIYEHLKIRDDFDSRGRADFTSHVVGAQFSCGVTDRVAVAIKGGALVDPQEDSQGNQWQSRAGYLYGIDLFNEVFPATEYRPGIQVSGGATGFQVPLDRVISGNTTTLVDQKISGIEYHGAVVAVWKILRVAPYAGLRAFGSSATWRDNQPNAGAPASITGHAHGNISVVAGLPVQISQDVRMQLEGRFVSETTLTVGFTIASF